MKKILFTAVVLVALTTVRAQYSIRVSMGIDFANTPALNDYINQNFPVDGNPLGDFNTAINFTGEAGFSITNTFQAGLEIGYLINSYNLSNELGKFEVNYNILSPSLFGYYVIAGSGYNFKFGGGLGIRFVNVDLLFPGSPISNNYKNTGFGFILRSEGSTLLGGNFYANIGIDLKYDLNGVPKSNGVKLHNNINQQDVNLNSLAVGLRLGISFII